MAQPTIIFNRNAGGLGRPVQGNDHISALLFYNDTLPVGFGANDRIKKIQSISDAETLGIVQGGIYSVEWYHLNECFRINEKCVLYIGIYSEPVSYSGHTFVEIELMQVFANGEIRQIGVYTNDAVFNSTIVVSMNAVAVSLATAKRGLSIGWSPNLFATADITTLISVRLASKYVSVLIGQDGGNSGLALFTANGISVGSIGLFIGVVSKSSVHESIGWVGKFDVVSGAEFDVPAFTNGQLVKNISNTALDTLDSLGYVFMKKFTDYIGTFFTFGNTSIDTTSDFSTIENNRTIEKAIRLTNASLLPLLNSPLKVDNTGKLSEDTIKTFESFADKGIEQMERDGELSGRDVIINPEQNVLATSKIEITLKLIPKGVAKEIVVNIGFTANL